MSRKITSIVLKSVIIVASIVGVTLSLVESISSALFFTIQSNVWIGATCLVGLAFIIFKVEIKKWMYTVKLIFTVSITLTGVVYCTMLAPLLGDIAYSLSNTLLHVVVPAAAIADFFVYDIGEYRMWECLLVTVPPFYYLGFAGIGFVRNWDFGYDGQNYPYFFLNWGSPTGAFGFSSEFPYMGVFYYILILLVFVIGIGVLYIWLANLLRRKNEQK